MFEITEIYERWEPDEGSVMHGEYKKIDGAYEQVELMERLRERAQARLDECRSTVDSIGPESDPDAIVRAKGLIPVLEKIIKAQIDALTQGKATIGRAGQLFKRMDRQLHEAVRHREATRGQLINAQAKEKAFNQSAPGNVKAEAERGQAAWDKIAADLLRAA